VSAAGGPDRVAIANTAAADLLAEAGIVEPEVTRAVQGIVEANGGTMALVDSRLKEHESLVRKILLFQRGRRSIDSVLQKIFDALRYTAVLPDEDYWLGGTRICEALAEAGCQHVKPSPGWNSTGYRGRNEGLRSPSGCRFELQIHTPASFRATEMTHPLYEEIRRSDTPWALKSYYQQVVNYFYAQVPVPPGMPPPVL
jgi:hypothetical protein